MYGTLLYNTTHKNILGKIITETSFDTLNNYERRIVDEEEDDHTSMVYQKDGVSVNGLLLNVTQEKLSKIDEYEGNMYKRACVTLESGKKAWIYVSPSS